MTNKRITLEETIQQSTTSKPDWWGYNDARRAHSEGFDATNKELDMVMKNVRSIKENIETYNENDIPAGMRTIMTSYVNAMKNLNEARKYFVAAGKAGNTHPNYNLALQRGQKFYNTALDQIREAKTTTMVQYQPENDQVHDKLAELHNNIVRRMTANNQSESVRKKHMKLVREHNTLAKIFREEKNHTVNLKNYSKKLIGESLVRLGYKTIRELKIQPRGVSWIK